MRPDRRPAWVVRFPVRVPISYGANYYRFVYLRAPEWIDEAEWRAVVDQLDSPLRSTDSITLEVSEFTVPFRVLEDAVAAAVRVNGEVLQVEAVAGLRGGFVWRVVGV